MSNQQKLIQIENLNKSFGNTQILNNISITVDSGEFLSIIGKSGSGKSTLLSILGLLEQKTAGYYLFDGHNVDVLTDEQLARLRGESIGWVFQNFNLLNDMTALENVILPTRYRTCNFDKKKRALQLLNRVGLQHKKDSYPAELSGGEQQRVSIARAMMMSPNLLFCDEPTGNLDSCNSHNISNYLIELNQQGVTIVLVTHDKELAAKASRTIKILDGKIADAV